MRLPRAFVFTAVLSAVIVGCGTVRDHQQVVQPKPVYRAVNTPPEDISEKDLEEIATVIGQKIIDVKPVIRAFKDERQMVSTGTAIGLYVPPYYVILHKTISWKVYDLHVLKGPKTYMLAFFKGLNPVPCNKVRPRLLPCHARKNIVIECDHLPEFIDREDSKMICDEIGLIPGLTNYTIRAFSLLNGKVIAYVGKYAIEMDKIEGRWQVVYISLPY